MEPCVNVPATPGTLMGGVLGQPGAYPLLSEQMAPPSAVRWQFTPAGETNVGLGVGVSAGAAGGAAVGAAPGTGETGNACSPPAGTGTGPAGGGHSCPRNRAFRL